MKKIQLHLASEPGIYFQVFLFNVCIIALQLTGSNLSGSLGEKADAIHIMTDQVVYFVMIITGALAFKYAGHERIIRSVSGLLGSLLFLFVGLDIIRDSYEKYLSGEHSVLGQYMLLFTTLAFILNYLQHKLLVTADSKDTLTSYDLQGHVKIDMYKNIGLVSIALLNTAVTLPHLDIILGLLIGIWLMYRGLVVLGRAYRLYFKQNIVMA